MRELRAGILGATGAVGQRLVQHLEGHPWIALHRVMASQRSSGKPYRDACDWQLDAPLPAEAGAMTVTGIEPAAGLDVVFSGLGADIAGPVEQAWAEQGVWVFSNARSHRMDPDVPLVIPEVNANHLELLEAQRRDRGWTGSIVTNANCSTTFLTLALAPLHREFGVDAVSVVTLQAISGAGHRGVPSMAIHGNVIPDIPGEEAKIESEPLKILGTLIGDRVTAAPITISSQVHRVPVLDGHMEAVSFRLKTQATLEQVRNALESFRGPPQELELPSAPKRPIVYLHGSDRPQPRLDLYVEAGMATVIGRLRPCPVLDFRMVVLGHNTIRGAGPGSVLNAEFCHATGLLEPSSP